MTVSVLCFRLRGLTPCWGWCVELCTWLMSASETASPTSCTPWKGKSASCSLVMTPGLRVLFKCSPGVLRACYLLTVPWPQGAVYPLRKLAGICISSKYPLLSAQIALVSSRSSRKWLRNTEFFLCVLLGQHWGVLNHPEVNGKESKPGLCGWRDFDFVKLICVSPKKRL